MSEILYAIGWNQIVVAFAAAAVWLLCRTTYLKRRPAICHGLWLLVLLKVVTPSFVPIPMLPAVAVPEANEPTPLSTAARSTGSELIRASALEESSFVDAPASGPIEATNASSLSPSREPRPAPPSSETTNESNPTSLVAAGVALSLIVTCLFWLVALRRFLRLRHLLRDDAESSERAAELLRQTSQQFELRVPASLRLVDASISPMLWAGLRGPVVVLPRTLASSLDDERLRSIFAHELAHFRRRDPWWSLFAFAVATLFWWNPAVWFARRQLLTAAETCCDAEALSRIAGSRKSYAQTLLAVVDFAAPTPGAISVEFGASHALRRRFEMIADSNVKGRAPRGSWLLLGVGIACLTLLPARGQEAPKSVAESAAPTVERARPAAASSDERKSEASVPEEIRASEPDGESLTDAEKIANLRRFTPWGSLAQADGVLGRVGALAVWPRWKGILPLGKDQAATIVKLDNLVREARALTREEAAEHPAEDYASYETYVDRILARERQAIEHAERMVEIGLLTAEQAKLVELRNEWRGHDWLTLESERAQDLLDATKEQRRELEAAFDEFGAREGTWEIWNPDENVRNKARRDRWAFHEEIEAKARELLTPEQAERWSRFVAERTLPEEPPLLPAYAAGTRDLVAEEPKQESPIFRVPEKHPPSYIGISPYQKRLLDDLADATRTGLYWIELQERRDVQAAKEGDIETIRQSCKAKSAEFLHHAEQVALVGILSPQQAERYWKLAQELQDAD